MMVFQIQITTSNDTLPITRRYIGKYEKAMAIHETAHRKTETATKTPHELKVGNQGRQQGIAN